MKDGSIFTLFACASLAVGVVWFFLTGHLWQFFPIAGGLGIGYFVYELIRKY